MLNVSRAERAGDASMRATRFRDVEAMEPEFLFSVLRRNCSLPGNYWLEETRFRTCGVPKKH